MGVDYEIFKFQKVIKNHLSACQRKDGVTKYFNTVNKSARKLCLALLNNLLVKIFIFRP